MVSMNDVAREWAKYNESDNPDRFKRNHLRGGNISFRGPSYFSYQTVVAMYFASRHDGRKYALISTGKWGVSTARHISTARRAVTFPHFHAPFMGNSPREIEGNLDYMLMQIERFADECIKKWNANWGAWTDENWVYQLKSMWGSMEDYAKHAGSVARYREPMDAMIARVGAARSAAYRTFYDPKSIAKRERARALRLAKAVILE